MKMKIKKANADALKMFGYAMNLGDASTPPLPPDFFVPGLAMFFEWLRREISEGNSKDAAERLYHLADLSVVNLREASREYPESFQAIAKNQLLWPSHVGWGADMNRANKQLLDILGVGTESPLNIARKGRKSASLVNTDTALAYGICQLIEMFRCDAQEIQPACSLVPTALRGVMFDVGKTGLSKKQIKELTKLKPLSRQNYLQWWKLGKTIFDHQYGKQFENHKDFQFRWENDAYKTLSARGKRPLVRRDIKNSIKQAVRSLAPKNS